MFKDVKNCIGLTKSITKECNSSATVSLIILRYGKLNEKARSVNCLLKVYCGYIDIRFVGHENVNPRKNLNRSGLDLNL